MSESRNHGRVVVFSDFADSSMPPHSLRTFTSLSVILGDGRQAEDIHKEVSQT